MNIFNIAEKAVPFALPFLLVFSRTTADFTVILIVILFLMKSFLNNDWQWLKEPWLKLIYFFFFYLIFINAFFSENVVDSLIYSVSFLRWPLFCVAIYYWIFKSQISIKKVFYSICVLLLFLTLHLWIQYFTNQSISRLSVPFSDNVIPGRFVLFYSVLALGILSFSKEVSFGSKNLLKIFTILFIAYGTIFITGERMVLLLITFSIFSILFGLFIDSKKNFIPMLIFLTSLLLFIIIFYYYIPEVFFRSIVSSQRKVFNLLNSDYGSVFLTAYHKWLNNPFVGGGFHQYRFIDPQIAPGLKNVDSTLHAHNYPLGLLVETGIIGFLIFYTTIIKITLINLKNLNNKSFYLNIVLLNLIFIYFFPISTHFSLSHNWINASAWLLLAFTFVLKNNEKKYTL